MDKILDILISLLAEQENVEITYHLEDIKKDDRDETA